MKRREEVHINPVAIKAKGDKELHRRRAELGVLQQDPEELRTMVVAMQTEHCQSLRISSRRCEGKVSIGFG